ncbi:MAG: CHAP domain-containing protein [Candidatus Nomurabacteria bacterium]|jgi:surface antigen|nr:CHAP domain-containing protein [Candidatus Nomurabacteria bacterium]
MKRTTKILLSLSAAAAASLVILKTLPAQADYLCVSAKCLAAEAAEAEANQKKSEAESQKGTYQAEVERYSAEIAATQASIDRIGEEIAELAVRIENTETKIGKLRKSISDTIVKLYVGQDMSELELIASAGSLSDLQTKTTNQEVVKGKLKQLSEEAKAAKAELEIQKQQQEIKKQDAENQQAANQQLRIEQQYMVNQYQADENSWQAIAEEHNAVKEAEREAQRLLIISKQGGAGYAGDPNKGGYPFSNQCPWNGDSYNLSDYAPFGNGWGYMCECVSYTGWRIYARTGGAINPRYWGNARNWYGRYGTNGGGYEPRANSVGVSTSGYYGHVFWVEGLNPNGTIHISQYNVKVWDYSEANISPSGYWYIYY